MSRTIIFAFVSAPAFIIAAVMGIVWMLPIPNSHVFTASSARAEGPNNNTNFLKEIENAPKDRYLQSNVSIGGFSLAADLALTSEQKEKCISVKDKLRENEAMLLFLMVRQTFILDEGYEISGWIVMAKWYRLKKVCNLVSQLLLAFCILQILIHNMC